MIVEGIVHLSPRFLAARWFQIGGVLVLYESLVEAHRPSPLGTAIRELVRPVTPNQDLVPGE